MSRRSDIVYGRRGGRFAPDRYVPVDVATAPRCSVCDRPMLLGQTTRHYVCDPDGPVPA